MAVCSGLLALSQRSCQARIQLLLGVDSVIMYFWDAPVRRMQVTYMSLTDLDSNRYCKRLRPDQLQISKPTRTYSEGLLCAVRQTQGGRVLFSDPELALMLYCLRYHLFV